MRAAECDRGACSRGSRVLGIDGVNPRDVIPNKLTTPRKERSVKIRDYKNGCQENLILPGLIIQEPLYSKNTMYSTLCSTEGTPPFDHFPSETRSLSIYTAHSWT